LCSIIALSFNVFLFALRSCAQLSRVGAPLHVLMFVCSPLHDRHSCALKV